MREKKTKLYLSCFYIGFLPFSPGTYGSLAGAIFVYFLSHHTYPLKSFEKTALLLTLVLFLSISSSVLIKRVIQDKIYDHSWIVIDEFIGMIIVLLPLFWNREKVFSTIVIGFICFRFFDIVKPLGISRIDKMPTPWAVVLDDVVAGVYALICASLLNVLILK